MKRMGRMSRVVVAAAVVLVAAGLPGCAVVGEVIAVAPYVGGCSETHGLAETDRDAIPRRSNELSPALPSPVETPPEKTDIMTVGEVVISVAPSRLKEAPRPRRFLDGR